MAEKLVSWNEERLDGPATSPDGFDQVAEGDWRALTLLPPDQGYGTVEAAGEIFLQDDHGRHIDTQNWLKEAHARGLRITGALIGVDRQKHG